MSVEMVASFAAGNIAVFATEPCSFKNQSGIEKYVV